jgi:nucleotide-binding universal stress UspA family protein
MKLKLTERGVVMAFSELLVAYDGSDLSNKALTYAHNLVKDSAAGQLHVVHIYQFPTVVLGESILPAPASVDEEYSEQAQQILSQAKSKLSSYPNTTFVLKQGQPAVELLEYSKEHGCDLIVMGSRGLGGIREFVLGSVSHNVVQQSRIPVLIIK